MTLSGHVANFVRLGRKAVDGWLDDYAPSMGAALAYYTMFSIAPLLVIVIAVAGLVFGEDAAQGRLFGELEGMIGDAGATAVQGLVKSASSHGASIVATIIGVVTLLIGATTVFGELQSDLDRVWNVPAKARPSGIWGLLRARFLSFGIVLGIGFILLVSLVISAALVALGNWWAPMLVGWNVVLQVLNLVVSLAIVTLLFAMIYKILPSRTIAWHDVWIGAAVTAVLFTFGKYLIGLYIGKSGVVSGFGAAGSIAVLLLWVYYSAQIFLLGAEFTYAYAHDCGSLRGVVARGGVAPGDAPRMSAQGIDAAALPSRAGGAALTQPMTQTPALLRPTALPGSVVANSAAAPHRHPAFADVAPGQVVDRPVNLAAALASAVIAGLAVGAVTRRIARLRRAR